MVFLYNDKVYLRLLLFIMLVKQKINQEFFINNRIDWKNYDKKECYDAGMKLISCEIKPILRGQVSLKGSYGKMDVNSEFYINNMYVYSTDYRKRKLLLNRKEIIRINTLMQSSYILIPECIYKYNNLLKIKLWLAKNIAKRDKKEKMKKIYQDFRKEARLNLLGKIAI